VVFPAGAWFDSRLHSLIEDLERTHPAWAARGNFGWLPGARMPLRCLKDSASLGLARTSCPIPVVALGPGALLLNAPRLRATGVHKDLENPAAVDAVTGLCSAGLKVDLLSFVDERLFMLHPGIRFEERAPATAKECLRLFDRALAHQRRTKPATLLDRFMHRSLLLEFQGKSYRLKEAAEKLARKTKSR